MLFSFGVYKTVAPIEGAQPLSNSVYKRSVSVTPSLSLMFHQSHAVFVVILFYFKEAFALFLVFPFFCEAFELLSYPVPEGMMQTPARVILY